MPRTRCAISKMPASTPLIITARPWARYVSGLFAQPGDAPRVARVRPGIPLHIVHA